LKHCCSVLSLSVFVLALLNLPARAQQPVPVHPVNPNYSAIKKHIDASVPKSVKTPGPAVVGSSPVTGVSWQGLAAGNYSPSDANGAIGPNSYIEMVNTEIGVYDRSGNLLSSNSEAGLTGFAAAAGDGEVIYSPQDSRFYASMLSFPKSGTPSLLIFGFSKGPSPSAAASDWCFYRSGFGGRYGNNLPDYPKLGQSADFILIGVNTFQFAQTYLASDVAWVSKPPAGNITTCPALSSLMLGVKTKLLNADGSLASTPVPANQVDGSSVDWIVANKDPGAGTSTVLSVFRVSKSATTGKPIFGAAKTVTVTAYAYPPSAPQAGTNDTLDTLDSRLTNAISATDPRVGAPVVWTQHTVAASTGGLGSEVRWYEIKPSTGTLFQNGIAQSSSAYVFMGAISPDRNGTSHQFGKNMVLGFNTSSSSTFPAAAMISKVGNNPASGFVAVASSTAADTDFSCTPPLPCRWGDYSGASPDPASATGNVWLSVMLNGSTGNPSWITWNWEATP